MSQAMLEGSQTEGAGAVRKLDALVVGAGVAGLY